MKKYFTLLLGLAMQVAAAAPAFGQAAFCGASANPPLVRSEGLAERLGDILLNCTGNPGSQVSGSIRVFLNIPITNRISTSNVTDVGLTLDTGSGPTPLNVPAYLISSNSIGFYGVNVTVPVLGRFALRIVNLRGAVSALGVANTQPILASLGVEGTTNLVINTGSIVAGFPQRALFASYAAGGIRCTGSPFPNTLTLASLFTAGTRFSSARFTEGFAYSFQKKDAVSDAGTRILVRYSGFPKNAHVYAPEVIAGSTATEPTSAGDFGGIQSAGAYTPGGNGSLLLARVPDADSSGAGGMPIAIPGLSGSAAIQFANAVEVPLVDGVGTITFEVLDADPAQREFAQFPSFIAMPPTPDATAVIAHQEVLLAATSGVASASTTAPVPRFTNTVPPNDCATLGDCDASYFPKLEISGQPLQFVALRESASQYRYVRLNNSGGGLLIWSASVSYKNGSGWIFIDQQSGFQSATIRVDALPRGLAKGVYEATLTIDGGPFTGSRDLPVRLEITDIPPPVEPPPPQEPRVVVSSLENLARPGSPVVAPGSLALVTGKGFIGVAFSAKFDGIDARVVSLNSQTITLEVPPALAGKSQAFFIVSVDGESSVPRGVPLADSAPAIFPNGILNADNTVNSPTSAALVGTPIQVFSTGLFSGVPGAVASRIHDRVVAPSWVGAAPGWIGINQSNWVIPSDLPAMTTEVLICGQPPATRDNVLCSPPVNLVLRTE